MAGGQLAKLPVTLGSYPITPASDILHELSKHKHFGVRTVQAEDEIAAVGMALGAAFAGHLGVTTTSGPGLALKSETISLALSLELPLLVVAQGALPAIRTVNHLVDGGRVIVRTRLTAKLTTAMRSSPTSHVVVAYQADDLDPQRQAGWSVVVTGLAITVTDPDEIARYEQLLHPWVHKADTVVAIEPQIVTGIRIVPASSGPDHT